jgi:hypothetical protein
MRRNKTMTQSQTKDRAPAAPAVPAAPAAPAAPVGQAIGQAVGQAESVLTRLLAGVLAEKGTTRQTYLALQRLSALGGAADREGYVRDLSDWLDLDLWAAQELAATMVADGLLTRGETIGMTDEGAGLRAGIVGSVGTVMGPVWAALDPADLETTVRTLREITVRARVALGAEDPDGGRS